MDFSFITSEDLMGLGKNINLRNYQELRLNIALNFSESLNNKVFLSHKHAELGQLENIIGLLTGNGADIYIDGNDKTMPDYTSGETAKRLREMINNSKKFILLVTEGSLNSHWCNWELGLGDAYKFKDGNLSIFPIDVDDGFAGNEYLQIYPYIKKKNTNYSDGQYCVIDPQKNTYQLLSNWIQE